MLWWKQDELNFFLVGMHGKALKKALYLLHSLHAWSSFSEIKEQEYEGEIYYKELDFMIIAAGKSYNLPSAN